MRYPFIFALFLSILTNFQTIQAVIYRENIAFNDPEAPYNLGFIVTRETTLGALKRTLLNDLKEAFDIGAFIETGTYLGYTTTEAAKVFEKVYTIELSQECFELAKENLTQFSHVQLYLGNSGEVLGKLLPTICSRTLFYLDGHYSGGVTAKGLENTPILEELIAIRDFGRSDSVILIDDIQLFQESCYPDKIRNTCLEGYPDYDQLVATLLQINPNFQICFLADALLAFPKDPLVSVSPAVNACTLHRLEKFCSLSDEDLLRADQAIATVSFPEDQEFANFCQIYGPVERKYGYPCFATFWQALILRERGDEQQALGLFKEVVQNSLPTWRFKNLSM